MKRPKSGKENVKNKEKLREDLNRKIIRNRSKDNVKRKENFVPIKLVQPDSVVKEGSYFERSLLEPTLTLRESLDQTVTQLTRLGWPGCLGSDQGWKIPTFFFFFFLKPSLIAYTCK